jgi:2,3-bisphosphoglycerate-dependent phosphoglycerate mutase
MGKLILMRHGQSQWNLYNVFTGWVDIPLSAQGVQESIEGGKKIKDLPIDIIFTSSLIRAQMTAMLAMTVHTSGKVPVIMHTEEGQTSDWSKIYSRQTESQTIPVIRAWELNERMYGELQGINKAELANKYGQEQVQIWRRSFDIEPPRGESLKVTAERSIPYFETYIVPHLQLGHSVFVAAHGNSLRSIIMQLDSLSPEQVVELEIATGEPIIYDFIDGQLIKETPLKNA